MKGQDTYILASKFRVETIFNFAKNEDILGLAGGLLYNFSTRFGAKAQLRTWFNVPVASVLPKN